ncbi:MAG TPA: hypothetical protein DDY78_11040 [Planctomycetales bacterium]|jgi:hypothetical protein|nr:hypothetical protein [Planctomycetales bacterium]
MATANGTAGGPYNVTASDAGTDTAKFVLTNNGSLAAPTVQFSTGSESVNAFSIMVTLSAASNADTMVPFTLTGTDYSSVAASPLVIKAGQTSGSITGTLINDGAPDAAKMLTFTLGTPTNATLGGMTTNTLTISETTMPPVAATIVFRQQPIGGPVLRPIPQVVVRVRDQFGNPVTSGVVTIAVAAGSAGALDSASNVNVLTENPFRGSIQFNGLNVTFVVSPASTPTQHNLTGTVFTVAASTTATSTTGISPSLASAIFDPGVPIQTASFQSTSQLTLTLAATQASQVSSTRSALTTNVVDGGGGDDLLSAAEALVQFLLDKWEHLPKFLFPHDSADAGRNTDNPMVPAPTEAPAAPEARPVPIGPQESISAFDLFFRDPASSFDWFTPTAPVSDAPEVGRRPRIEHRNPAAFAASAAVGLGLYVSGNEKRRKGRRSPSGRL